jgi:hypothetical protein
MNGRCPGAFNLAPLRPTSFASGPSRADFVELAGVCDIARSNFVGPAADSRFGRLRRVAFRPRLASASAGSSHWISSCRSSGANTLNVQPPSLVRSSETDPDRAWVAGPRLPPFVARWQHKARANPMLALFPGAPTQNCGPRSYSVAFSA